MWNKIKSIKKGVKKTVSDEPQKEQYYVPRGDWYQLRTNTSRNIDLKRLQQQIQNGKIAPCYPQSQEDDNTLEDDLEECPICLMMYPALNRARCCRASICTECFIQVTKQVEARCRRTCPFCNKPNYEVLFRGPKTKQERQQEQEEEQKMIEAELRNRQLQSVPCVQQDTRQDTHVASSSSSSLVMTSTRQTASSEQQAGQFTFLPDTPAGEMIWPQPQPTNASNNCSSDAAYDQLPLFSNDPFTFTRNYGQHTPDAPDHAPQSTGIARVAGGTEPLSQPSVREVQYVPKELLALGLSNEDLEEILLDMAIQTSESGTREATAPSNAHPLAQAQEPTSPSRPTPNPVSPRDFGAMNQVQAAPPPPGSEANTREGMGGVVSTPTPYGYAFGQLGNEGIAQQAVLSQDNVHSVRNVCNSVIHQGRAAPQPAAPPSSYTTPLQTAPQPQRGIQPQSLAPTQRQMDDRPMYQDTQELGVGVRDTQEGPVAAGRSQVSVHPLLSEEEQLRLAVARSLASHKREKARAEGALGLFGQGEGGRSSLQDSTRQGTSTGQGVEGYHNSTQGSESTGAVIGQSWGLGGGTEAWESGSNSNQGWGSASSTTLGQGGTTPVKGSTTQAQGVITLGQGASALGYGSASAWSPNTINVAGDGENSAQKDGRLQSGGSTQFYDSFLKGIHSRESGKVEPSERVARGEGSGQSPKHVGDRKGKWNPFIGEAEDDGDGEFNVIQVEEEFGSGGQRARSLLDKMQQFQSVQQEKQSTWSCWQGNTETCTERQPADSVQWQQQQQQQQQQWQYNADPFKALASTWSTENACVDSKPMNARYDTDSDNMGKAVQLGESSEVGHSTDRVIVHGEHSQLIGSLLSQSSNAARPSSTVAVKRSGNPFLDDSVVCDAVGLEAEGQTAQQCTSAAAGATLDMTSWEMFGDERGSGEGVQLQQGVLSQDVEGQNSNICMVQEEQRGDLVRQERVQASGDVLNGGSYGGEGNYSCGVCPGSVEQDCGALQEDGGVNDCDVQGCREETGTDRPLNNDQLLNETGMQGLGSADNDQGVQNTSQGRGNGQDKGGGEQGGHELHDSVQGISLEHEKQQDIGMQSGSGQQQNSGPSDATCETCMVDQQNNGSVAVQGRGSGDEGTDSVQATSGDGVGQCADYSTSQQMSTGNELIVDGAPLTDSKPGGDSIAVGDSTEQPVSAQFVVSTPVDSVTSMVDAPPVADSTPEASNSIRCTTSEQTLDSSTTPEEADNEVQQTAQKGLQETPHDSTQQQQTNTDAFYLTVNTPAYLVESKSETGCSSNTEYADVEDSTHESVFQSPRAPVDQQVPNPDVPAQTDTTQQPDTSQHDPSWHSTAQHELPCVSTPPCPTRQTRNIACTPTTLTVVSDPSPPPHTTHRHTASSTRSPTGPVCECVTPTKPQHPQPVSGHLSSDHTTAQLRPNPRTHTCTTPVDLKNFPGVVILVENPPWGGAGYRLGVLDPEDPSTPGYMAMAQQLEHLQGQGQGQYARDGYGQASTSAGDSAGGLLDVLVQRVVNMKDAEVKQRVEEGDRRLRDMYKDM